MIFRRPVFDRLHDVVPHHFAFRSRLIAAARGVRIGAVGVVAVEIAGDREVEIRAFDRSRVVVNHVEDNPHAVAVEAHDHLLEFADARRGIGRIGRIAALRNVVVLRIVSPVVALVSQPRLVHRCKVERRQDMNVRHAQLFEVVQSGCLPFRRPGAGFGQGQEPALVFDSGIRSDAEVAVVQFIENDVGIHLLLGRTVRPPPFGIGVAEVDNGRPVAVNADRPGPDARRLGQPSAVRLDLEGVENAFQIAVNRDAPGPAVGAFHLQPLLRLPTFARSIEIHAGSVGRGRPKPENGALRGIRQLQIGSVIGRIFVVCLRLYGVGMILRCFHRIRFMNSYSGTRRRPAAQTACAWGMRNGAPPERRSSGFPGSCPMSLAERRLVSRCSRRT